jgi:hypothetical protein
MPKIAVCWLWEIGGVTRVEPRVVINRRGLLSFGCAKVPKFLHIFSTGLLGVFRRQKYQFLSVVFSFPTLSTLLITITTKY